MFLLLVFTKYIKNYATAVLWEAELYMQDKHFENLARVHYFSK